MNASTQPPVIESAPLLALTVACHGDWMAQVSEALSALAHPPAWGAQQRYFVELVLEELILNAGTHGRPLAASACIEARLWQAGELALIEVVDDGAPFDPGQASDPDLEAPLAQRQLGGLGLYLVRQLCDGLHHERRDRRNHVWVWRRDRPEGPA